MKKEYWVSMTLYYFKRVLPLNRQLSQILKLHVLLYVTRPVKIDHVGTFIHLKNTNLKYSMPNNSPVSDSSHVRFTQEAQQGNSY